MSLVLGSGKTPVDGAFYKWLIWLESTVGDPAENIVFYADFMQFFMRSDKL